MTRAQPSSSHSEDRQCSGDGTCTESSPGVRATFTAISYRWRNDTCCSPDGRPRGYLRLLVVEDEPTIAEAVVLRLVSEGFDVECPRRTLAVERCAEVEFALIVLDLGLPGLDGIEVCRRIQAERPTPVVMLTARDDEMDLLVGLGVGADDYITKPFSPVSWSPGSVRYSAGSRRRRQPPWPP
ncbi:MAG: response regulator [Acidimicrobiales bacterium]